MLTEPLKRPWWPYPVYGLGSWGRDSSLPVLGAWLLTAEFFSLDSCSAPVQSAPCDSHLENNKCLMNVLPCARSVSSALPIVAHLILRKPKLLFFIFSRWWNWGTEKCPINYSVQIKKKARWKLSTLNLLYSLSKWCGALFVSGFSGPGLTLSLWSDYEPFCNHGLVP